MAADGSGLADDSVFRRCRAALAADRLDRAQADAQALTAAHPTAAEAWHLLGLVASRQDRLEEAAAHFDRARTLAPRDPAILFDGAVVAGRRGQHAAALKALDEVLRLRPDHAGAWANRGQALRHLDRPAEALACFDRALVLAPSLAEALHGRAHVLAGLGRAEQALLAYDRALAADPSLVDALIGKANVLIALDRAEEALAWFDRAEACIGVGADSPAAVNLHQFRAEALTALGRCDAALASFDRALAIAPGHVEAMLGKGRALFELNAHDEALAAYDAAIRLRPDHALAHDHRGRVLRELGRLEEALAAADRAVALCPEDAGIRNSRGNTLRMLGRLDEALAEYDRSVARNGQHGPLRFNRGVCHLLRGDYERGWPDYEFRWTTERMIRRRPRFHQPQWTGAEPVAGRRILLHAEQGLGDTIQFCRYAPLLGARGANVILGVQPELRALLASLPDVAEVIDRAGPPPVFDRHCPLLSLPLAFGTTLATVPAQVPYLAAPPGHRAAWQERLAAAPRPRIGLAWSGNPNHGNDRRRSIPLALLAPLLGAGVPVHAVQRDLRAEDMATFAVSRALRFHGPELRDFCDTAALLGRMDLVITVDTAVAHLAGALARPTWLLLPFAPDWRWLVSGERTPWYPTMRLFRQGADQDWGPVIRRVRACLDRFIADFGGTSAGGS